MTKICILHAWHRCSEQMLFLNIEYEYAKLLVGSVFGQIRPVSRDAAKKTITAKLIYAIKVPCKFTNGIHKYCILHNLNTIHVITDYVDSIS